MRRWPLSGWRASPRPPNRAASHGRSAMAAANKDDGRKRIAENRKARREYHLSDTYEAGIAPTGTEAKSLSGGQANIAESYASAATGGISPTNAHTPQYQPPGGSFPPDPTPPP